MAVTEPCYCSREDVKRAVDMKQTARNNWQVDRAIQSVSRNIDKHLHRRFYPEDTVRYFDWPNFQYAYPWRLWFDQYELAAVPTAVTTGGVAIPVSAINFEPVNSGPPYTYMEIQRNTNYGFGSGPTPQHDIAVTGTFGYWLQTSPAGSLAAAISSVSATSCTVTDGSLVGVGNLLIVDGERMLVSDRSNVATTQTNLTGLTTASVNDITGTVADGTQLHVDEVIQIDSERMLVVDVTGNAITVKRAWDGFPLATHNTGSTIYAQRQLTLARGQLGTAATTHLNGAPAVIHRVPQLIRDLAVAEATNRVLEETGGYSDPEGEGAGALHGLGSALADLWDEAETGYGRKARRRTI
jgi:sirohydrochlorin ferrochelatase